MSQIIAIDENGVVAGAESYDNRNDAGRATRRQQAVERVAERLNVDAPAMGKRAVQYADYEWFPTTVDTIAVGMVEMGLGRWGYATEAQR